MVKLTGGRVGSKDDPTLDAKTRLLKKLEEEGKTLADLGKDENKDKPKPKDEVKIQ